MMSVLRFAVPLLCALAAFDVGAQVISLEHPIMTPTGQAANGGAFATNSSHGRALSRNGRYFVFRSGATNLTPGVLGTQVYLHDRQTRTLELISTGSNGPGSGDSLNPSISGDGRYVVFYSEANNLVAGDTNGVGDIFVRDRVAQTTRRVSLSPQGTELSSISFDPAISGDGRTVAFATLASPPNSTLEFAQVYAVDLATGLPELVSRTPSGGAGTGDSSEPALSADGRKIVFQSNALELVGAPPTFAQEIMLWDRDSGQMELVSVPAPGGNGTGGNFGPSISDDGRRVAFSANASLDPLDNNGVVDGYVRDRWLGTTTVATIGHGNNRMTVGASYPVISADGRWIVFTTTSPDVVPGGPSGIAHVYVRHLSTGEIALASTNRNGVWANSSSIYPVIGGNASIVGFACDATNLIPDAGPQTSLSTMYLAQPAVDGIHADGF